MVIILLLPIELFFFCGRFYSALPEGTKKRQQRRSRSVLLPLAHCCCVDTRNSVRPVCCGLVPGSRGRSCGQSGIDFSSLHALNHGYELLPQNLPRVHVHVCMCV